MNLETKRLILRPWQESDAEDLYRYASSPEVGPIAGWPIHTSVENSLEIIKAVLLKPETYAVVLKSEGRVAGSIGLMIGNENHMGLPDTEGEIGYWIGVPFWGQGLISEAVREIIRYAFEDLHLEKLWCGYFDGNMKSKRVQEKCGFTYHHTIKDIPCPLMGDIRTEHITCLPKDNWIVETRKLENHEINDALSLVWDVFMQFEAPEYSKEGIDEFRRTLDDSERIGRMKFYGAIENNQIVGVLAMRSPQHISFFFVKADHHHRGIGKKLFKNMKKDYELQVFTVNSSPYAVEIYKHLGFVPTNIEQLTNGIRHTPMKYEEVE